MDWRFIQQLLPNFIFCVYKDAVQTQWLAATVAQMQPAVAWKQVNGWIPLGLNGVGGGTRLDGWFLESLISQSSPSAGLFGRANKRLINRQNMFSLLLQSTSAGRKVCATHFDSGGYLITSLFCPATALELAWLLLHFLPLSDISETAAFASRFHQIDWTRHNRHQH